MSCETQHVCMCVCVCLYVYCTTLYLCFYCTVVEKVFNFQDMIYYPRGTIHTYISDFSH